MTYDLHVTPNITRSQTRVREVGASVRLLGRHLNGQVETRLTQEGTSAYMSVACISDTGTNPSHHSYGCRVASLPAAAPGGFWNLSVVSTSGRWTSGSLSGGLGGAVIMPAARSVDLSSGHLYDVELLPRITAVQPRYGSNRGGQTITVHGHGFGGQLEARVGTTACVVGRVSASSFECLIDGVEADLASANGGVWPLDRGVRWQRYSQSATWTDLDQLAFQTATGEQVLGSFETPSSPWGSYSGNRLSGWFVPPTS